MATTVNAGRRWPERSHRYRFDLADASKWRYGSGLDLTFSKKQIVPRLKAEGFDDALIADLTGQNVARRLAWEKIGIS